MRSDAGHHFYSNLTLLGKKDFTKLIIFEDRSRGTKITFGRLVAFSADVPTMTVAT
jgi:hypothetical protein